MKRLCCLVGLLFLGCNRAPQLVDQQILGKDLASLHQASDPSLLVRINNRHARYLFEYESFAELDAFLTRAEKWDPVETLCTPLSMLDELRNTQDGGFPWMVYHSRQWMARAKHSEWAPAAEALAVMNQGERMCDLTGWNAFPPYNQGQELMDEANRLGEAIQNGHPGYPLIDYYRMVREKSARQTILEAVRKNPREIALYTYLATVLSNEPKAERNKHLKTMAREMPDCYALHFTLQLRGARRRLASGLWDWEALKVGFEKLLQEHPNALGVRNAYAVAAMVFEDKKLTAQQAALLGYHWDPDFWGSLREYQEGLGTDHDYHLAASSLPGLKLDEAISKQTRLRYPSWEAQCLLRKGQWVALEVFLRSLPQPELRHEAGEALEEGDEENEASYKKQEALLRDWQAARPDSEVVHTALGGFYISYAWLARGSGYANTVSASGWEKFRERLETGAKFLNAPVNE